MIVIKRFKNRKLYELGMGTYITLSRIKELINIDQEFMIIDNASKRDITKNAMLELLISEIRSGNMIISGLEFTNVKQLLANREVRL